MIASLFLGVLILFALIAPLCSSYASDETHLALKNLSPCKQFWFGTDELGRDLFTRIWWGARISLSIGLAASCIDLLIGILFAATAVLLGGRIEQILLQIADILYSIPYLLVVILLTTWIGPGFFSILLALTLTGWIKIARILRSQFLQIKQMGFVQTATILGANKSKILLDHLLPNCLGQIIITLTLTIPSAIFAEAFLSFLGLGIQAPFASWGTMASDALTALQSHPWRLVFPASFISLTLLAFSLVGEGLRDAFDPRSIP